MINQLSIDQIATILSQHLCEFEGQQLELDRRFGTTNITYKVSAGCHKVIFRILSPIIDRIYENSVLRVLEQEKICPKTIHLALDHRIEEFLDEVEHPSPSGINADAELQKKIIVKLHEMHQVQLPKSLHKSFMDQVIFTHKSYINYQAQSCQEPGKEEKFEALKHQLLSQFQSIHKKIQHNFKDKQSTFKLSHNDANCGNIFVRQNRDREIVLIDFQYTCYNYVAYDIANFLNQCCIEYGPFEPGFKIIKRVTPDEIDKACQNYPGRYQGMDKDVYFMLMVCNFAWGLWSLEVAPTHPFSPIEHGLARLQLFNEYRENYAKQENS